MKDELAVCRASLATAAAAVLVTLLASPLLHAQTVTLPLEQYDALRARAYPPPDAPVSPTMGVSFESVDLKVVMSERTARVTAVATLWLHDENWQSLPWPAGLPLLALRAPTAEVRLETDGAAHRLAVRGQPGRHRIEIDSSLLTATTGTATEPATHLTLPLPAAAQVRGALHTANAGQEVSTGTAGQLRRMGDAHWDFAGRPGETLWFTISGAALAAEAERPLRFDVTSTTALALQRTRRQADAWLSGQVIEGRLEALTMPAPEGFEVVSVEGVEGTGDVGWSVREGQLEILFAGAIPPSWQIHATLAADAAEESSIPVLLPTAARRTFVVTKAEARGGGLLEPVATGAGRPLEPSEQTRLPAAFRGRVGEALVSPPDAPTPRWRVTWPQESRVLGAQVDRLLVDVLVGEHGRSFYQVWAEVRANGAPDLGVRFPTGARLVESRRDGVVARPGQRGDSWVSPLVSRDAVQILYWSAEVTLPWPTTDGAQIAIPLPAASSPISTVEVRAGLPSGFRFDWVDPSRRGEIGNVPYPRREEGGANELGRQLLANTLQKLAPPGNDVGWQAFPGGWQVLTATWSSLDTAPSPLVLTVRKTTEARP